ncbi:MAG TPA: cytochrome c [Chloroflexia bacterium]|nr:cytochrome c [Chloroflexia bacterium]
MATDQGVSYEAEEQEEEKPKKGRGFLPWIIILAIIVLGGLATAPLIGQIILREETPLPGEALGSDLAIRYLAVPSDQVDRKMPSTANATRGQVSYEAECIICHGQGGKGDGQYGKLLYPNASDLTASRTQTKTDGMLFWEIAHGVNLTGMPGFGKDYPPGYHTDDEIWDLVAYVRSLAAK